MLRSSKVLDLNHKKIFTGKSGINEIVSGILKAIGNHENIDLEIKMDQSYHIDANLAAVIASIGDVLFETKGIRLLLNLSRDRNNIFIRNGLKSFLERGNTSAGIIDDRKSTIILKSFDIDQDDKFADYIYDDFMEHERLYHYEDKLELISHYTEVFANSFSYSETEKIYVCGQFFPSTNKLNFTFVDTGIGFYPRIKKQNTTSIYSDLDAIIWAMKEYNTTKDIIKDGPGGSGLSNLWKYCSSSGNCLQICSGYGFVEAKGSKIYKSELEKPFPGSIVSISIKLFE